MRIVLVTDRYWPEARAAAYLSSELAAGLVAKGHHVTVLTRTPTRFVAGVANGTDCARYESEISGVKVRRFRGFAGDGFVVRVFDHLLIALKCFLALGLVGRDARVFVMSPPLAITVGVVLRAVFGVGGGYVLNLHDLYPRAAIELGVLRNPFLIWVLKGYERLLYHRAAVILAAAPSTVNILRQEYGLPEDRVRLLHNFVNVDAVSDRPRQNRIRKKLGLDKQFVILYAGLMGVAQDLDVVIRCARQSAHKGEWVFVLFGDGPKKRHWQDLAAGMNNVVFQGPVSTAEYVEVVAAADVCIVPLVAEFKAPAIPGKVSSIMACGRPIVALVPEGNDTRKIIEEAACGVVLTSGDTEGMCDALGTISRDPELWSEMSRNGRCYARANFSVEVAVGICEEALSVA
jgi:colanic acid biosynthesis glycosyl transferase WcaI